ncbi:MAG: transposase [Paludibacteraceae bacterium]|nr:transposase [Paludibacteraceae bacterium]
MNHYSTDLTNNQWQVIEKFLDVQVRKRKYSLRSIVNAIIADGGYRGKLLSDTLKATLGCELEVVLRPDECPSKFQVMPKRWIIERSFAWQENFRRLAIDYEFRAETTVVMIQLAFCFLMLNKIF